MIFRKNLLDEYPEDPDYTPLDEDRPGGFNWGGANNNFLNNDRPGAPPGENPGAQNPPAQPNNQ